MFHYIKCRNHITKDRFGCTKHYFLPHSECFVSAQTMDVLLDKRMRRRHADVSAIEYRIPIYQVSVIVQQSLTAVP